MEPQIRFCSSADGTRIGYGVVGKGPALMLVFSFGNGIEPAWEQPECIQFCERLATDRMLVLVNRRGFGPSGRDVEDLSLEAQASDLEAVVIDLGLGEVALWGYLDAIASCVAFAVDHPDKVKKLILWDAYVEGSDMGSDAQIQGLMELMRTNWSLATRAMADITFPSGPVELQRWFSSQFRASITPEMAIRYLMFASGLDLRPYLRRLRTPTLVLQRRGGRVVPLGAARAVASIIPNARFLTIDGDMAYSLLGDVSYLSEVEAFLDEGSEIKQKASPTDAARLSAREIEVLKLLAAGRTNQDIADTLVISTNTVSHHVTNILNKAGLSNRTEAAAYAHRAGVV